MSKVQILPLKSDVFDFIHRESKSDATNLQSEFKINNVYYPRIEVF